jgi:membrane protein YqaA with SNARE-associated domain
MGEFLSWVKNLNGLKTGTLLGGVFGCTLYLIAKRGYNPMGLLIVAVLGTATGTALHSILQYVLKRPMEVREFHKDLDELCELRKNKTITKRTYQQMINGIVRRRFLGKK